LRHRLVSPRSSEECQQKARQNYYGLRLDMVVVSVNELEFKRARKSLNKNMRHVSSKLVLDDSEGSLVGVGACHSAGELQGTVIGFNVPSPDPRTPTSACSHQTRGIGSDSSNNSRESSTIAAAVLHYAKRGGNGHLYHRSSILRVSVAVQPKASVSAQVLVISGCQQATARPSTDQDTGIHLVRIFGRGARLVHCESPLPW
jgi:hypothetical protein